MLLKINVSNAKILRNTLQEGTNNGELILKCDYYSAFSNPAWLCSIPGSTLEDAKKNSAGHGKSICVGQKGGISVG